MSDNSSCPSSPSQALLSRSPLLRVAALVAGSLFAACSSGGGGTAGGVVATTSQPQVSSVQYGRLADVYGLQTTPEGSTITLYRKDVLIGPDIQDERATNETKRDDEILYDFIGSDPDTLQPRLFIPREITADAFKVAFEALDDQAREVVPMVYGTNGPGRPFAVVPRNAAVQVNFSAPLGVDDSFFVERNAAGQVVGLRNTEAVQLLRLAGDPSQPGGLVPIPVRVVVGERTLILDPVLLGSEGLQYQTRNNASGLPASPDQVSANIRVAIAMEGPLAIPSLRETLGLTGLNNSGRKSIVRDFRSGNADDTSADLAKGFVRDPLPLRIVGEIVMYLERVERINAFTQEVTIYKNGVNHEVDRGDVLRFISDNSGVPFAASEVVVDPADDQGQPTVQHVRVRIRNVPNLDSIDPRNLPGYPATLSEREPWLVLNAPKAVCVAEFSAGDGVGTNGDDPRYFLSFTPTPLPNLDGTPSAPNENVSPFAGAVVRFTKPVDIGTVKWADTFFFAMRDLASQASIDDFIATRPNNAGQLGMDPAAFNLAKYRTPYLITARVFDEDGSQTALRLQPTTGFYLDDTMRNPPAGADYRFYLHLIANSTDGGVRDLAGNEVDLQATTPAYSNNVVIPFTVDTRMNGTIPFFENNLAISLVSRFASRDEDSQPSYFLSNEVPAPGSATPAASYPLEDLVGAFVYLDGKLQARPTTRVRQVADNLNQAPVAAQGTNLQWCPLSLGGENQVASNSATTLFTAGIQNPLNPYGCRLQTLWREVDLSLSRTDPYDFNLDVEQMYWAPFTGTTLVFDEFDRVSMFLGHSEYRPAPCVGDFSSLPSLPNSGVKTVFQKNFVWNPAPVGTGTAIESQPAPWPAYVDQSMTIDPATVVYEVNHVNRFLPLPTFQKPYFVFRDETVVEQGCESNEGNDANPAGSSYMPYILSPFSNGLGRHWVDDDASIKFVSSFWNDCNDYSLTTTTTRDLFTGGMVGNVGLPLLADFWTYCDSANLPAGNGYVALGTNGWQIALTVQSSPVPNFRTYSAGRSALPNGSAPICRGPGDSQWNTASGGYSLPGGAVTTPSDNSFYWIMMDLLKRQSVITNGFIDLNNPHRVPEGFADPRLGPFYLTGGNSTRPADVVPTFAFEFDPPLSQMPGGTSVVPQFRAASAVDDAPWYYTKWAQAATNLYPNALWTSPATVRPQLKPDASNFPLDPFKAADAHIRKWDQRSIPGTSTSRNWWTYFYNRTVTSYVEDPNQLMDPAYTIQFAGPNESFTPRDVRYVNWRFVTSNNVDANPPVAPSIETFSLSYRYQRVQ
jgi:hypothetical protein